MHIATVPRTYHTVYTNDMIEELFKDAHTHQDAADDAQYPDVTALCQETVPAREIIVIEPGKAYIPLPTAGGPPRTRAELPAVCINCAMTVFRQVDDTTEPREPVFMWDVGYDVWLEARANGARESNGSAA